MRKVPPRASPPFRSTACSCAMRDSSSTRQAGDHADGEEGDDGEKFGMEIDSAASRRGAWTRPMPPIPRRRRDEGRSYAPEDRNHDHDQEGPQEKSRQPERRSGRPEAEGEHCGGADRSQPGGPSAGGAWLPECPLHQSSTDCHSVTVTDRGSGIPVRAAVPDVASNPPQSAEDGAGPDSGYPRSCAAVDRQATGEPIMGRWYGRTTSRTASISAKAIRVVLADDDVLLREGLASLLQRSGFDGHRTGR